MNYYKSRVARGRISGFLIGRAISVAPYPKGIRFGAAETISGGSATLIQQPACRAAYATT
jgi:hypothetical protein